MYITFIFTHHPSTHIGYQIHTPTHPAILQYATTETMLFVVLAFCCICVFPIYSVKLYFCNFFLLSHINVLLCNHSW